jgi:hypothetical protein
MQREREIKAKLDAERGYNKSESEYESTDSSDEEEQVGLAQVHANIDSLTKTPRATTSKSADFLIIIYEEGMDRIEMPWRTEQKEKAKKEAPVTKVHDKKNFKGINES